MEQKKMVNEALNEKTDTIDLCCEAEGMKAACCGNCRYYDGDGWCGQHSRSTTGGDYCSYWEE